MCLIQLFLVAYQKPLLEQLCVPNAPHTTLTTTLLCCYIVFLCNCDMDVVLLLFFVTQVRFLFRAHVLQMALAFYKLNARFN